MDDINIQRQIEDLCKRVTSLESVIIPKKTNKPVTGKVLTHSGPKGGILLLKEEGFLKVKKTTDEVRVAIENKGYIYDRHVIQTALNRLSKSTGPLVKIEEKGKKVYVERK